MRKWPIVTNLVMMSREPLINRPTMLQIAMVYNRALVHQSNIDADRVIPIQRRKVPMSYMLMRRLLFTLSPETSHTVAMGAISLVERLRLQSLIRRSPQSGADTSLELMGLKLPNPVGLAAGLDKNAEHIDALAALGFGFIEVGTLTPRPQPGNPRPRLFRLAEHQAIINRMGFNNKGMDYALGRIARSTYRGVLGINIGKNFDTPVENAADDYLTCMRKAYPAASYLVVNLSSPNTPGLRTLQFGDELSRLLATLKEEQQRLTAEHGKHVPLVLKIAPDLDESEISMIAKTVLATSFEGVIATNTTVSREGVGGHAHAQQAGGLSGQPLGARADEVVACLRSELGAGVPIIGVGGIGSRSDATKRILAGADALQIYTGFIYRGPELIAEAIDGYMDARRLNADDKSGNQAGERSGRQETDS